MFAASFGERLAVNRHFETCDCDYCTGAYWRDAHIRHRRSVSERNDKRGFAMKCEHCNRKATTRAVYQNRETGFLVYLCAQCEFLWRKDQEK